MATSIDGSWSDATNSSPSPSNQPNLLRRFIDEGDILLGRVLETKEGRDIYASVREGVETDEINFAYDACFTELLDYAEKHGLTSDDAKIIACAMIQKAVLECIQKELRE